ncbi:MAG: hypothetical protein M3Y08_00595 [Fibrobacterota bacterium]|nr:hypothetical protein [Fibrobacterota bacterium]
MISDPKPIEIELDFDGRPKAKTTFVSGKSHAISLKRPVLHLRHLYHDNRPVAGAAFQVELENGSLIRGHLDEKGEAEVKPLRSRPLKVRYGLDPRPFEIMDTAQNPGYLESFTQKDAEALVERQASVPSRTPEEQNLALDTLDWIWGTVRGGFNQKQSVSQIIVDAAIGMIPLVGDVTAVRDIFAVLLGMAQDPKKREDKWEWLTLVILLFALIPVLGGVLKGVGKLLLKGGREAAQASVHLGDLVAVLNRMGMGDALAWIQKLNLEAYTGEILGRYQELSHRIDAVLESVLSHMKGVMPESMRQSLVSLRAQLRTLAFKAKEMIPDAVKELNERLKAAQRQLYEGEWHGVPKSLKTRTREVEARLVDSPQGPKWEAGKMHFPPNGRDAYFHRDEWPDLGDKSNGKYVTVDTEEIATYKIISCFSGEMRAVKIPPGTKIYRVIGKGGKKAGDWWAYTLPETGKEWREGSAVLDSWNRNGRYVELEVPEEGLWVWQGKAASQVENDHTKWKTVGQYLPGGHIQIFVDFSFQKNAQAAGKISKPKGTHWRGHKNLNVPGKSVDVEVLGPFELESKNRGLAKAGARLLHLKTDEEE